MKKVIHLSIGCICMLFLWMGSIDSDSELLGNFLKQVSEFDLEFVQNQLDQVKRLDVVQNLIQGADQVKN